MGNQLNKTIKTLAQTIKKSSGEKTKSYDKSAEVVRVEGDTAWVHVPGGVEATPVKMTISAKKGDKVKVHFSKGSAWITGNLTSPPTDDASVTELEEDVVVIKDTIESADFGKGEDGEPGASVSKIVFQYCLSDSNQLDPEGDVDMITDDWLDYIPTIDDVPKDEDEYELEATEIEDVQTSGEYSMGEIVYQIVSVSVNGAAFTSYTVENKDDEGDICTFVVFDKTALPATVTSIAITFIAGLEPFYYIWQRTLTYRDDMDEEEDEPIEGTPQLYGTISSASSDMDFTIKTIIREETEYCLASSTAIPSGGTFEDIQVTQWSVGVPTYQAGNYFWSRIKYYYSDGTVSYSPPAYDFSAQVAHEVATAEASTDNHFWSDQSGAYVGHYEEDATRGAVLRAVGEGVLLYYDNKKKAAFTDSGVSFWDGTAGNETQLATYANGGISFNDNVPFSIGNNSSYIKWVKENNVWKIKIAADTIEMGGSPITDGADGGRWYSGTAMTGTSTTGTIFSGSGIADAVVGDMYLNTATSNTYRCTVAGGPTVARWVFVNNIKGNTGAPGSDTSSQYMTFNSNGTYAGLQIFSGTKTSSTYNVHFSLMRSDGLHVYTASTERAVFGTTIRLGAESGLYSTMTSDSFSIYDPDTTDYTIRLMGKLSSTPRLIVGRNSSDTSYSVLANNFLRFWYKNEAVCTLTGGKNQDSGVGNLQCTSDIMFTGARGVISANGGYLARYADNESSIGNASTNTRIRGNKVYRSGSGTSFDSSSDVRLKTDMTPVDYASNVILGLDIFEFSWKSGLDDDLEEPRYDNNRHVGTSAQQVRQILSDNNVDLKTSSLVGKDGDYYTLNYGDFIPLLIRTVQDLNTRIKALERSN